MLDKKGMAKLLALMLLIFLWPKMAWAEPKLWAESAILMNRETGQIYYQKEANRSKHPASLTKIMTCILAIEQGNLDTVVTISRRVANINVGQTINLRPGQKLKLEDLVYAALLHSANDAAVAIAEEIGGSEETFLAMMNKKALAIGATKTHFENANGYTAPNHRTTAFDLALITNYAMSNSTFSNIVKTKDKTITKIGEGKVQIKNVNKLLKGYPYAVGVKTGTTAPAGGCLSAMAVKDGQELISIVLHSGNTRRYQDSIELLEYGFENFKEVELFKQGEQWDEIFIDQGKPQQLKIVVAEDLKLRFTKEQLNRAEKVVKINYSPNLPIDKGDKIGEVTLRVDDREITTIDLVAANKIVERTFWNNLVP